MTHEEFVAKLEGVRRAGEGWEARCPAHDDHRQSLSVATGEGGKILLRCHAGCRAQDIVGKLGLRMGDLFPSADGQRRERTKVVATYDYRDESGTLLYQVQRLEPKSFRQRRPDGRGGWEWKLNGVRRVLYRLPEILAAPAEAIIHIAEGEKDVDGLARLGLVATCNAQGAGKWSPDYADALRGRRVVVLADNDQPGRQHAAQVALSLMGKARSIKMPELPGLLEKGDVSDWLAAGGTADRLASLADAAPEWTPAAESEEEPEAEERPGWAVFSIGDLADRFIGTLERRRQGAFQPVATGLPTLDDRLGGGLQPGSTTVFNAAPGHGKTSQAVDWGLAFSRGLKRPTLFWSLELSVEDVLSRIVGGQRGVSWGRVRSGEAIDDARAAMADLGGVPFALVDRTMVSSVSALETGARALAERWGAPPFIVVDYVQLLIDGQHEMRQEMEATSGKLLDLAIRCDCVVLELSAVGRASYNLTKGAKRPDSMAALAMAKETGRLEADAGTVLGLLPVHVEDEDPRRRYGWLALSKNRYGAGLDCVSVVFDGLRGTLTEVDPDEIGRAVAAGAHRDGPDGGTPKLKQKIVECLTKATARGEEITSADTICERVPGRAAVVRDAIKDLVNDGAIAHPTKRSPFTLVQP